MSEIETLSLLFDSAWYLATYQDVAAANCDPLEHYMTFGYKEGRNPNRFFNTNFYLTTYPDLASSHLNPFIHYVLYGALEGRLPRPPHEEPLPTIIFDIFLYEEEPVKEEIEIPPPQTTQDTNAIEQTAENIEEDIAIITPEKPVKKETSTATRKTKKTVRKPAPKTKSAALAQKRKKLTQD